jgi:deoxyribonuclease-4
MIHYLGAHFDSSCNSLIESAEKIKSAGGNLIQIFLTCPGTKKTQERTINELIKFKNYLINNDMKVVVHSSFLHNIGRKWDNYSYWITNIILEIQYSHMIGAICLVLHLGKKLELSLQETYNNMYTALLYIHNNTKQYEDVVIALETSSGQGSEVATTLDELSYFYNKFATNPLQSFRHRIKICLDTCHIFQAGMDKFENKNDVKKFLKEWDNKIGIANIKLVHLNNAAYEFKSHRDVHANILIGHINENALKHFYKFFRKNNIPIVLETPNYGYKSEIKMLKKQ